MPDVPIALAALCIVTSFCRDLRIALVAVVLLANWGVNSGLVWVTGDEYCWPIFMCVDYVSALTIMIIGSHITRWQVAVIGLFAAMIVVHVLYATGSQGPWDQYNYWYRLYCLAWSQIIVVGMWGVDERLCIRDGFRNAIKPLVLCGKAAWARLK